MTGYTVEHDAGGVAIRNAEGGTVHQGRTWRATAVHLAFALEELGKFRAEIAKLPADEETMSIDEVRAELKAAGLTGISSCAAGKLLGTIAALTNENAKLLEIVDKLVADVRWYGHTIATGYREAARSAEAHWYSTSAQLLAAAQKGGE